jgi:hypothetical protein
MAAWGAPSRGRRCHACRVTMRARAATALLTAVLTGAPLLTGCGGGDTPAAQSSMTPSSGASADDTAEAPAPPTPGDTEQDGADAPPFTANTEPDVAEQSAGARGTVRDLRLGRHDGFDRVVFEVGGTGTPGWDVRYVDVASSQGKGDVVEVAGDAILQVTLTGMGYPFDTGVEEYAGPDPLIAAATEAITEVVWDSTFEGTSVAFVGTTARTPFRVYLLEEPARVVVEVADPS